MRLRAAAGHVAPVVLQQRAVGEVRDTNEEGLSVWGEGDAGYLAEEVHLLHLWCQVWRGEVW